MTQVTLNLNDMSLDDWDRTRSMIDAYFGISNVTTLGILENRVTPDKITVNPDQVALLMSETSCTEDEATNTLMNYGDDLDGALSYARDCWPKLQTETEEDNVSDEEDPDIQELDEEDPDIQELDEEEAECVPELDSDGIPWDPRIHSRGKTKLNDGTWRLKKGISEETLELVRKELLARPATTEPEPSTTPPPPAKEEESGNVPPPPPAKEETEALMPFPEILTKIREGVQSGDVQPAAINDWLESQGIEGGVPMLSNKPELHADFIKEFNL